MLKFKQLQFLKYLGIDFWLPLPVLGLLFWLAANLATQHIFKHSANVFIQPQEIRTVANYTNPDRQIFSIKVKVFRELGFCRVYIKKTTEKIERSQFQLPTTDLSRVKFTISQKLNLPLEQLDERTIYLYK
ncbi:MAG: hypothetical protein AAF208_07170 [Cyanobacteria bacterium P01_A01_bin.45]